MANVLIAEDNPVNQRIYSQMLRTRGHTVLVASNGQAALEMLAAHTIDLAIIDLAMPVMDGLTLLRHMRANAQHQQTPVIMLTASGQDEDRRHAEAEGANAFLTKPSSSQEFNATVSRLLNA